MIRRPLRFIALHNFSFAIYIFWETSKIINSKLIDVVYHQIKSYYFSDWSKCVKRWTVFYFLLYIQCFEVYVLWKLSRWCSELKSKFIMKDYFHISYILHAFAQHFNHLNNAVFLRKYNLTEFYLKLQIL